MIKRVTYQREGSVAVIRMDDGKVNAMSPDMIAAVGSALDRAETEGVPVVLTGRSGVFSGGFDLSVMKSAGLDTLRMLRGGFELSARLLAFPYPVVVACNGHAIAMGAFLVLSADYRIGTDGDFALQANEVAIGLTLPRAAVEICRHRLTPGYFDRVALLSESFDPRGAVAAGFLDRVVDEDVLLAEALEHAEGLTRLDMRAHARSKQRVRAGALRAIRKGLAADMRELTLLGARKLLSARLAPASARWARAR